MEQEKKPDSDAHKFIVYNYVDENTPITKGWIMDGKARIEEIEIKYNEDTSLQYKETITVEIIGDITHLSPTDKAQE